MPPDPTVSPTAPLFALLRHFRHPRFWPVWLGMVGLRGMAWLPLPVIYMFGMGLGELLFIGARSRRGIALRNLSACFPDHSPQAIHQLARKHFRYFAYGVLATGVGWWASKARLLKLVRPVNDADWRQLRSDQQNLILLMAHFTSLEFCGMYFAATSSAIAMYRQEKNPLLDTLIRRYRLRFGGTLFTRQQAPHGLVREIRRGHPCCYLSDQNARHGAVFADFFGVSTSTSLAPVRLAELGRAVLLPVGIRALPFGRGFELHFLKPLTLDSKTPDHAARQINRALEKLIMRAPEQYYWLHRKFKTRPPGVEGFYD